MEGFGFFLEILSIVFFTLSLNASKVYMQTKDPKCYASVKSRGTLATVFFVISCIRLGATLVTLIGSLATLMGDSDITTDDIENLEAVFAIASVGIVFSIVVFIVGIAALVKYGKAKKTYSILAPKYNAMNKGVDAANPFGDLPTGNNSRNYNGNYNRTNGNNANFSGTNPQVGINKQANYQNNCNINDPAKLHSVSKDQSPFEAPPPVYTNYNYGNGNRQTGTFPTAPYDQLNNQQNRSAYKQPASSSNYRQPANSQGATNSANSPNPFSPSDSFPANQKTVYGNTANANIAEPKQYVSQMPEVTPISEPKPSATPPETPVIPVVLPTVEIKRDPTVRCKHCGVTNKAEDKICTFCGKSLTD